MMERLRLDNQSALKDEKGKITRPESAGEEIYLLDLVYVVAKRARMIILFTLLAFFVTVLYAYQLPNYYSATVTFMMPQNNSPSAMTALAAKLGNLAPIASDYLGINTSSDFYVALLKSKLIADEIAEKYNLKSMFDAKTKKQDIRKYVTGKIDTEIFAKEGLMSISVSDTDPVVAADMANTLAVLLDKKINEFSVSKTRQRRLFLESRLKEIKDNLQNCEDAITSFKIKNSVYQIDAQAAATITAIGTLQGQITAKEIELKVLKISNNESHPLVIATQKHLEELNRKLDQLETGSATDEIGFVMPLEKNAIKATFLANDKNKNEAGEESDKYTGPYVVLKKVPQLSVEMARLYREQVIQETLFKVITEQFELAKIDEAKESQNLTILDKAIPPEIKAGPNRKVLIVSYTGAIFFISLLLCFIIEYWDKTLKDPDDKKKILSIYRAFIMKKNEE